MEQNLTNSPALSVTPSFILCFLCLIFILGSARFKDTRYNLSVSYWTNCPACISQKSYVSAATSRIWNLIFDTGWVKTVELFSVDKQKPVLLIRFCIFPQLCTIGDDLEAVCDVCKMTSVVRNNCLKRDCNREALGTGMRCLGIKWRNVSRFAKKK